MMKQVWTFIFLLGLLFGCAREYRVPAGFSPETNLDRSSYCAGEWLDALGQFRILETMVFTYGEHVLPLQGVVQFNTQDDSARTTAVNEFGIKLFDISVAASSFNVHFLFPALARIPNFAERLGMSVRRMFFERYSPCPEEAFTDGRILLLVRRGIARTLVFSFDLKDKRLLSKECPEEGWRAEYSGRMEVKGLILPEKIIYYDGRAGFTLAATLRRVEQL